MNETQDNSAQSRTEHFSQLPGFWPVVVFLLTLATHGFYVFEMAGHPFFNFPLVDSDTYHRQALDILRHGWVGEKAFWQAPLYPCFLALCYHFITVKFFDIRVIQAALAAINGVLLYHVGRRMIGRGVGIGAAVAAAFYGPLIYYDGEMLAPVLIVTTYLLLALALDRALKEGPGRWWVLSGVLVGLAALAHGLALVILLLVCAYAIFGRQTRPRPGSKRFLAAALLVLGALVIIAPVTIRNRLVSGEWVLISYNGPINLYIGNHPDYDKMVGLRPGLEWGTLARSLNQEGISTIGDSSRYFTQGALRNMREHPLAVARVWLKKLFLFFNADELKRDYPIYPVRDYSRLMWATLWKWRGPGGLIGLGFPFGVVLPLAAVGWWALRRRGVRLPAVEMIVAGHFLANMMFFICSRYRIPLAPFFLLYAAAAVQWAIGERLWEARAMRLNGTPLVAALAIFLFSNARLTPMKNLSDQSEYEFHLGYVCQMTRKPNEALECYLAALRADPELTEAHFFLGILYQDSLGQSDKALEQFDWVLARDPDNMSVLYNRALALNGIGRSEEARKIMETLIENDPENPKYQSFLDMLLKKPAIPPSGNEPAAKAGPSPPAAKSSTP